MADIPLDKAQMIAFFVECVVFGWFCVLYLITMWLLLKKRAAEHTGNIMMYTVTTMFVLAVAHLAVDLVRLLEAFIDNKGVEDGANKYYENISNPLEATKTALYATQTIVGDSFVTYRTWVVWNRQWLVSVLPAMLIIASAVAGYGCTHEMTKTNMGNIFSPALVPWITAFFSLTFCTNVVCTGLISARLYWRQRSIGEHTYSGTTLWPVIQLVIESGAIYSAAVIALLIAYLCGTNGQYPALDIIQPLIGVTFSLILVRVGLGIKGGVSSASEIHPTAATRSRGGVDHQYPMKPLSINVSRLVERDNETDLDQDTQKVSQGSESNYAFKAV